MSFPHEQFGLPLAENYSYTVDSALVSSTVSSQWRRQRRTYMHSASLLTLTFRLSTQKAHDLVQWLEANQSWFDMMLLTGNDADVTCGIHYNSVRRTSEISCNRIVFVNQFIVSFEVETRALDGYDALKTSSLGNVSGDYPVGLPIPVMEGFKSTHAQRNLTGYSLTYRMTTQTLKQWLAFAMFQGTAWFKSPMVSANVPCGKEWIRYNSEPSISLIRPNVFEVNIGAESMPASIPLADVRKPLDYTTPPPVSQCAYDDAGITYDDVLHNYECIDVGPSLFVVPATDAKVVKQTAGYSPLTSSVQFVLKADGTTQSDGVLTPEWPRWYSVAPPLSDVSPIWLSIPAGVEYSLLDGSGTWVVSTGADVLLNDVVMVGSGLAIRHSFTATSTGNYPSSLEQFTFKQADANGQPTPTLSFKLQFELGMTVTPVAPTNPFVTDFGAIGSYVRTPAQEEARASITIKAWNAPEYRGSLVALSGRVLGDPLETFTVDWVKQGEIGGAGNYSIVVTNAAGQISPGNGTYPLATETSELEFSVSALGASPTQGQTVTGSASIAIQKDGQVVSSGVINLTAVSNGVIT